MKGHNYLTFLSLIAVAISPSLMGFSSVINQLSAQPKASNLRQISLEFPPRGDRSSPKSTTGGGTRGDENNCIAIKEGEIPLVALMPNRENIGKTANSSPTLYWYMPATTATTGEFSITDEQKNEVYYTSFSLPNQPGIIKINVPQKANLQPGKTYSWSFMVVCDPNSRTKDQFVEGKIEYISLNDELKEQLKDKSNLEKAQFYAQNSIWFETLDLIAQMHSEKTAEWQQLLQSVGLEKIAEKPFIECCQPKE